MYVYLANSIEQGTLLVRPPRIPENILHWILPDGSHPHGLQLAPPDGVDGSTGAVVHRDGVVWLAGNLPGCCYGQVDRDVHWHKVCYLLSPII